MSDIKKLESKILKHLKRNSLTRKDLETILDLRFEDQKVKIEEILTQFRSDTFDKLDPILKEISDNRDERIIISHKISEHSDRLEIIENHLGIQPSY